MADVSRIKLINQKRATLKAQLTNLENLCATEEFDATNAKLRSVKLSQLYHKYEELHEELSILDPENPNLGEIQDIETRFYAISSKIENLNQQALPASNSAANLSITSTETNQKSLKLPTSELPTFDGNFKKWLSFKNTFLGMVDANPKINDLQRIIFLSKNCLQGEASKVIAIYDLSAENYKPAWNLLVQTYDKKRILIAGHLDEIIELLNVSKVNPKQLNDIVTNIRQHVNMLKTLNVQPDEHMLVRMIEHIMPFHARIKWEEGLDLQTFPSFENLAKFLSDSALRVFNTQQNNRQEKHGKRNFSNDKGETSRKSKKDNNGERIFLANHNDLKSSNFMTCRYCNQKDHYIYCCQEFLKLPIPKRLDFINSSKLCKNCLRKHKDQKCTFSKCRVCNKFHNTLLHKSSNSTTNKTSQNEPSTNSSNNA